MMGRHFRFSNIIYLLVAISASCSLLLILWSLKNAPKHDRKDFIGEESNVKFRTTFQFADPLSKKATDATLDQVGVLKKELAYAQKSARESNQNKAPGCNKINVPRCEVIHIAIVCAGYKETRRVVTLIKSIIFYRTRPIHFHFISDVGGRHVLQVLFKTWHLEQVDISFYDADKLKKEVEWIPNSHYSGVFGLMKLTVTKALPDYLNKVIMLDTDMFFLTDITELWSLFEHFSQKQAIGLVENQSEWYTGKLWKKYKHWPALGRGFNTGVILMDLEKLRSINWPQLWRMTAEKQLVSLLSTILADQDVINAALKDNPYLVYTLPCFWNIQLSENTQSGNCYTDVAQLKVIHWNSPKKHGGKHKHVEYFRNMYLTFLQYDGNLLRKKIFTCNLEANETVVPKHLDEEDLCYDFHYEQSLKRRVHLYYIEYSYSPQNNDITLMAHLSMDRIQILDRLAHHWPGPMSIALYVSDAEAQQFIRYITKTTVFGDENNKRQNIGIHVVYKDGDLYPVNYLRNIALEQVQSEHVFLSDIDFVPAKNLYSQLQSIIRTSNIEKTAVVVPAFETFQYNLKNFPETKLELRNLLHAGKVTTFRSDVWPQGHAPTDYGKWQTTETNYKIEWAVDFEPYILVSKRNLPLYDMRFVGFGWNKVSHIMHLHALRYKFVVAANSFLIHMPHAPSIDISKYRTNSNYRSCLKLLKQNFRASLESQYNIRYLKQNMKFKRDPSGCGVLSFGEVTVETPGCIAYTRNGMLPHLLEDMVEDHLDFPTHVREVPLSTVCEHPGLEVLKEFKKPYHEFVNLKDYVLILNPHDCYLEKADLFKYNEEKSMSLWVPGGRRKITPENYMEHIETFGFDIAIPPSDCIPQQKAKKRCFKSADRTIKFLDVCLQIKQDKQLVIPLLAVVEGGDSVEERERCSKQLSTREVQGYVLSGFNHVLNNFKQLLNTSTKHLSKEKVKFLFGVVTPVEVIDGIEVGIDVFNTVIAFDCAERGCALSFKYLNKRRREQNSSEVLNSGTISSSQGDVNKANHIAKCGKNLEEFEIDLNEKRYASDMSKLVGGCGCYCCIHHTRAYIHHLLVTKEMLAGVLLSLHNLHHWFSFFEEVRQANRDNRLNDLKRLIDES